MLRHRTQDVTWFRLLSQLGQHVERACRMGHIVSHVGTHRAEQNTGGVDFTALLTLARRIESVVVSVSEYREARCALKRGRSTAARGCVESAGACALVHRVVAELNRRADCCAHVVVPTT